MLPPKSCVLFEPISESFHKGNYRVGIRLLHFRFHCSSSPLSTSSGSDASEGLTLRLLELLEFSRLINLEQESKSQKHHQVGSHALLKLVLLESLDEKSLNNVADGWQMPIMTHFQSANKLVFTKGRQYPMWPSTKQQIL